MPSSVTAELAQAEVQVQDANLKDFDCPVKQDTAGCTCHCCQSLYVYVYGLKLRRGMDVTVKTFGWIGHRFLEISRVSRQHSYHG